MLGRLRRKRKAPGVSEPEISSTRQGDVELREARDGRHIERGGIGEDQGIETADSSSEEGMCTNLEDDATMPTRTTAANPFAKVSHGTSRKPGSSPRMGGVEDRSSSEGANLEHRPCVL